MVRQSDEYKLKFFQLNQKRFLIVILGFIALFLLIGLIYVYNENCINYRVVRRLNIYSKISFALK